MTGPQANSVMMTLSFIKVDGIKAFDCLPLVSTMIFIRFVDCAAFADCCRKLPSPLVASLNCAVISFTHELFNRAYPGLKLLKPRLVNPDIIAIASKQMSTVLWFLRVRRFHNGNCLSSAESYFHS